MLPHMKHFIWIVATIALTFGGDRLGGYALHKITENSGFRYARLYNGQAKADILLIGNSRGLTFYQPHIEAITGKKTFNLSYNGMPMNLAATLADDYLAKYTAPQLAIIDVTICDRENAALINGFTSYISMSPRLDSLIGVTDTATQNAAKLSHLYRYNNEIADRTLYYRGQRSDEDWLLDRVISDNMLAAADTMSPYSITLEKNMVAALKHTVRALHAQGVDVKLVINPYFPAFADKITNMQAYKTGIETAIGLPVLDYSRAVAGAENFGDYQHLNKAGSQKFLDLLFTDLKADISGLTK